MTYYTYRESIIIKKLYILIAALILLVGCGSKTEEVNADINNNEIEEQVENEEVNEENERASLPFDVEVFYDKYYNTIDERFDVEDATQVIADDWTIAMLFGSMDEALIILNIIDEMVDGNDMSGFAKEFAQDLLEDGYYLIDGTVDGLKININAIDINSVSISILND